MAARALKTGAATGLVVTASHNPVADNGVKLVEPTGYMLDQAWEVGWLPFPTSVAKMTPGMQPDHFLPSSMQWHVSSQAKGIQSGKPGEGQWLRRSLSSVDMSHRLGRIDWQMQRMLKLCVPSSETSSNGRTSLTVSPGDCACELRVGTNYAS